jgi:NAD(P)-dependent dehydrogenase (short-subunit alcohol dehydrogenase family)
MASHENSRKLLLAAAGVGAGLLARELVRRKREADLHGRVVFITGGSRGLGLQLAREFAREGCKVALCARDEDELERARADLSERGAIALTLRCDVSDAGQVHQAISQASGHFGGIDILVNNAGTIQVGPIQNMTVDDFENAMDVIFWGTLYPTLAVLPEMLERGAGRIVNITSIGGKVSVPHLIPYNCAKFAAVALSEGLRAELGGCGIHVLTVVPGLMRTGSYLNAFYKGKAESELAWFGPSASMPLLSISAERAARQIVRAVRRAESEQIVSLPAKLLALFHGVFPGLTAEILSLINRVLLPAPAQGGEAKQRGMEVQEKVRSRLFGAVTSLGRSAAGQLNQYS